ncbi:hypothetical protein [Comamonas testosteroni]|uniref:hypothetical protein n=1 Tax=Comamonas testosteroni TaxID=285 RepID=UPI0012FF275D|nr:hypothetical protein [Comamonas testosteroni]
MYKRLFTIAWIFLIFTNPAYAQRVGLTRGAGMVSCGEFIEIHQSGRSNAAFSQWAMGYMSAYNHFASHPQVNIPEPATINLYAEKFCKENPLGRFAGAVSALIAESGGFKPSGFKDKNQNY